MKKYILMVCLFVFTLAVHAEPYLESSLFEKEQLSIKYSIFAGESSDQTLISQVMESGQDEAPEFSESVKHKSPGKAFFMSLVLPGLGQYYNGDKVKPLIFIGAEITSWFLYVKWHGDGNDLTDAYEDYNDKYWHKDRYDDMILWTYGANDDEEVDAMYQEINHHLPDTKTQQYYEMTGKYDQFSWGWDDAVLLSDSTTYEDYNISNPFPFLSEKVNVPYSAHRFEYETMRNDANNKFDRARRMIYVSMLNRIISGFEAMLTAKKINNQNQSGSSILSHVSLNASIRSFNDVSDTPYLTCNIKF